MLGKEVIGIAAPALIIAIDQLGKYIVLKRVGIDGSVRVGSLLRIQVAANRSGKTRRSWKGHVLLLALIVAIVVYLNVHTRFFQNDLAQIGLGGAIGGAESNLFDRIWHLRVIDFIDFGFWPPFNFADVAIVLVVALIVWSIR